MASKYESVEDIIAERDRLLSAAARYEADDVRYLQEIALLRKDAERYRWLREREVEIQRHSTVGKRASARLDEQIDAAIEQARSVG